MLNEIFWTVHQTENVREPWSSLAMDLPITKINPVSERRRLLSACRVRGITLPEEIFNYSAGEPTGKRSAFRFDGGRKFTIYAAGKEASQILTEQKDLINCLISESYDREIPGEFETGLYSATKSEELFAYRVKGMVIQRRPRDFDAFCMMSPEELTEYAKSLLVKHLDVEMGITNTGDFSMCDKDILIEDVSYATSFTYNPKTTIHLGLGQFRFKTNVDLKGVYHVGHMVANGYGLILRDNQE